MPTEWLYDDDDDRGVNGRAVLDGIRSDGGRRAAIREWRNNRLDGNYPGLDGNKYSSNGCRASGENVFKKKGAPNSKEVEYISLVLQGMETGREQLLVKSRCG